MFNMEELDLLHKKNGEILDSTEWNTLVGVINYIIEFYNHYPTKLSEFENDIVGLFIGPKGDKGDKGEKGDKGDTGEQGPKGQDGTVSFAQLTNEQRESLRGPQGIQGELGVQGILGELGIQGIQGEKGNPFTYNDFTPELLEGLRGPQGILGPQGELGIQGILGETGATGQNGHSPVITASKNGSVTTISVDGTAVATINDGQNGLNGTNGTNGENGQDGLNGTSAYWFTGTAVTGTGNNISANINNSKAGDMYLNTSTYNVYTATAANKWDYVCNIKGESGLNGTNGTNGNNGITPHIDSTTGNWFIGTTDTGVHALGPAGQDGTAAGLIQADWNQSDNTQVSYIRNKPTIPVVPTNVSSFTNDAGYLTSHLSLTDYVLKSQTAGLLKNDGTVDTNTYLTTHQDISGKANSADLATVATSGSYNDLLNKPTIPTKTGDLENDSDFLQHVSQDLYVDMGLPSGTLWAKKNIDVTQADGFAASEYLYDCSFFSWGNVDGHNPTSTNSFAPYSFGSSNNEESYVSSAGAKISYPSSAGFRHDAACVNLGGLWRIPSTNDFAELFNADYTKFIDADGNDIASDTVDKRITLNSVMGIRLKSKINGNILFFPCSGYGNGSSWNYHGSSGYYWSRSLNSAAHGRYLLFYSSGVNPQGNNYRYFGFAVRPVINTKFAPSNVAITGNYNDLTNKPTIPVIWSGTQAQYDAITTPDTNTIYIITSAS